MSVAREKVREAWLKLGVENPDADFSICTLETEAKEAELNELIVSYERGRCELSDVRRAWAEFVAAQLEAGKPKLLFEL